MYISHYSHRCLYVYNIALFHEKLFRLGAYCFDDRVCEEFFLVKARDAFVQVNAGYEMSAQYLSDANQESYTVTLAYCYAELRDVSEIEREVGDHPSILRALPDFEFSMMPYWKDKCVEQKFCVESAQTSCM